MSEKSWAEANPWPESPPVPQHIKGIAEQCWKPVQYGPPHFDYRKFYHEVNKATVKNCRDLFEEEGNGAWHYLNAHFHSLP
jgi:hypothetical protein